MGIESKALAGILLMVILLTGCRTSEIRRSRVRIISEEPIPVGELNQPQVEGEPAPSGFLP